jgi:hypothetical protein
MQNASENQSKSMKRSMDHPEVERSFMVGLVFFFEKLSEDKTRTMD